MEQSTTVPHLRKIVSLLGLLFFSLVSVNAHAQNYAFGYSGFTSSNNLDINGIPYYNTDSGWINSAGFHGGGNANYYSGEFDCGGTGVCKDYFSFDLSGLSGKITSASFNVYTYTVSVAGPYTLWGTSLTPGEVNSSNTFTNLGYYNGLSSGPSVASVSLAPGQSYGDVTINLNNAGLAWLQANEGNGVVLGGAFGQVPTATPEPASLLLFASGLATLGGFLKRKSLPTS
jgi:hypothetical protein